MQGIVAPLCQLAVDRDQILHTTDLAGQDDLIAVHAHFLRTAGRIQGGRDQRFIHDRFSIPRHRAAAVFVHQAGQQLLVQAAPVHADAHGLVPAQGGFNHLPKLFVVLVTFAHIARIDAVL